MTTEYMNLKAATKAMLANNNSNVIGCKAEYQPVVKPYWRVSLLVMVPDGNDKWVVL